MIAGGKGERLRPLTDDLPKPMVPICNTPLIAHQIQALVRGGVTDVIFATGYRANKIREYFGDGGGHGFRAHYSHEVSPLGRGGAIKQGLALIPPEVSSFLVMNGDILTTQPVAALQSRMHQTKAMAAIMLTPYPNAYGVVRASSDGLHVTAFAEKAAIPLWINAGLYVMQHSIEPLLPTVGDHETETFPKLVQENSLAAYMSQATWMSVESMKDVNRASELISNGTFDEELTLRLTTAQ